ncbi:hypothetical protein AGIG_G14000 [Arapaima gigas]
MISNVIIPLNTNPGVRSGGRAAVHCGGTRDWTLYRTLLYRGKVTLRCTALNSLTGRADRALSCGKHGGCGGGAQRRRERAALSYTPLSARRTSKRYCLVRRRDAPLRLRSRAGFARPSAAERGCGCARRRSPDGRAALRSLRRSPEVSFGTGAPRQAAAPLRDVNPGEEWVSSRG